jgi:hypothetical protein
MFLLPAAPAAALAASEWPSLPLVSSAAAAAAIAAHRSPSPLVGGGGGRIRARLLVHAGSVAAGQRATAAAVAGPVWAAMSAVGPLPRSFSSQAQGMAQQTPV